MASGKSQSESSIAVYGAITANFLIAASKLTAAFFTGSSAMISEVETIDWLEHQIEQRYPPINRIFIEADAFGDQSDHADTQRRSAV